MDAILFKITDAYLDIMENKSDPRVKDWFLMSGPGPTMLICLTYALVVTKIGPKLMEGRKPFELKRTLIVYNAFQVLFSIWLFSEAINAGWFTTYSFKCQPVDYSNSPHALRTAAGCWWYYISKFTEFLDTIFFVLRKKNNQITRLHVIHHGVMPLSTWFGVKFTPGGHSTFFGMLNTFVHIVMYTYYMLAAFGPEIQKYLWWKKYLTVMQMVQFVLVMVHAFQLLFIDCDYPKAFVWWIGLHAFMFYFLFKDFYNEAYKKKSLKLEAAKKKTDDDPIPNSKADGVTSNNSTSHMNGSATKYNGNIINGNGIKSNGSAFTSNGCTITSNGKDTHSYMNGNTHYSESGVIRNGYTSESRHRTSEKL